jgi:hypothetical protein
LSQIVGSTYLFSSVEKGNFVVRFDRYLTSRGTYEGTIIEGKGKRGKFKATLLDIKNATKKEEDNG